MKVGYFTHTNISPSETFIYDLVMGLSGDKDLDLTFVTGQKKKPIGVNFELNAIASGYSDSPLNLSFKAYKLGQVLGGKGFYFKSEIQKRGAYKALNKSKLENFDVAYVDYATSGVLLMEYFKEKNIPFVVHVHGYDVTSALSDPYYKKELELLFQRAHFFITASNYIKRILILNGCEEDKIKVIRYGVDSSTVEPLEWKERVKNNPSIIFLGRLTEKKHPLALLQAFYLVQKQIPEATLTIIGDGPLKQEVERRIETLNLQKKVQLLGVLNRNQSFPILNKHWVYAQHSVTAPGGDQEGFAISLSEAAIHELPVVSTIHNGITENVLDQVSGFLVPEYNYEAMAEKIIYLIQNPNIAEKMGKAGRKHIIEICNPDQRIENIKELLTKIVKARKLQ